MSHKGWNELLICNVSEARKIYLNNFALCFSVTLGISLFFIYKLDEFTKNAFYQQLTQSYSRIVSFYFQIWDRDR